MYDCGLRMWKGHFVACLKALFLISSSESEDNTRVEINSSCVLVSFVRAAHVRSLLRHTSHSLEPVYFEIATFNVRKKLHMAILFRVCLDNPRKQPFCQEVGLDIT